MRKLGCSKKMIATFMTLVIALVLLSACGQKGPLILPQTKPVEAVQVLPIEPEPSSSSPVSESVNK